jgi:hypothetical protein
MHKQILISSSLVSIKVTVSSGMPEVYYASRVNGAAETRSSSFLNVEHSVRAPRVKSLDVSLPEMFQLRWRA